VNLPKHRFSKPFMSLNRLLIQRLNTMNTIQKLLEPYSTKTQHWIVSSGIELYERSKTIPETILHSTDSTDSTDSNTTLHNSTHY